MSSPRYCFPIARSRTWHLPTIDQVYKTTPPTVSGGRTEQDKTLVSRFRGFEVGLRRSSTIWETTRHTWGNKRASTHRWGSYRLAGTPPLRRSGKTRRRPLPLNRPKISRLIRAVGLRLLHKRRSSPPGQVRSGRTIEFKCLLSTTIWGSSFK